MTRKTCAIGPMRSLPLCIAVLLLAGAGRAEGKLQALQAHIDSLPSGNYSRVVESFAYFRSHLSPDDSSQQQGLRIVLEYAEQQLGEIARAVNLHEIESSLRKIERIEYERGRPRFRMYTDSICNLDEMDLDSASIRIHNEHRGSFEALCRQLKDGLKMVLGCEGLLNLYVDYALIRDSLLSAYTGAYTDYYVLEHEYADWACDAGTKWSVLRERLLAYEQFHRGHPGLLESTRIVKPETDRMFRLFLTGMDNTRVVEYQTGKIPEELMANYREYLQATSCAERKQALAGLVAIYEASGHVMNDEARARILELTGAKLIEL